MRMNISSLLAFVLVCNVTAEIIHRVMTERDVVTLRCPHSVEGKVTWSRETSGRKVDMLVIDGDEDKRLINDRYKFFSSLADKSLHIFRAAVSDSGRYFCNNEPAARLTVIPAGTTRLTAPEGTSVTLSCPPHDAGRSDVPTWSRDAGGKGTGEQIQSQRRFHVSTEDKTLIVTDVQLGDSGLYYCDGKSAAYLTVTEAPPHLWPTFLRLLGAFLVSAVIVTLAVSAWRRNR